MEDEEVVSKEEGVEKSEEDLPVAAFSTTRSKAKNVSSPDIVEKPVSMSLMTTIPSENTQIDPCQPQQRRIWPTHMNRKPSCQMHLLQLRRKFWTHLSLGLLWQI